MSTVAAVLVVRNEAHRIRQTLEKIEPHVDQIVVIDQTSEDDTRKIAQDFGFALAGKKSFSLGVDPPHGYCEISRPFGVRLALEEWVLLLDADEEVTDEFAQFLALLRSDAIFHPADSYYLVRETFIEGHMPVVDTHLRLFRKGAVEIETQLHGCARALNPLRADGLALVAIVSYKSADEQNSDNERYAQLADEAWNATENRDRYAHG